MSVPGKVMPAMLAAGAIAAAFAARGRERPPVPFAVFDDFERGLCVGGCRDARAPAPVWALRQEVDGVVAVVPAPLRSGHVLRAAAGPKGAGVTKADLVLRAAPIGEGRVIAVSFDLLIPQATPANSIQLVDLECASCGEGGNPGIRLYLRRGRLRIDRSKIGITEAGARAWVRDDAPVVTQGRWHRIVWIVRVAAGESGTARVTLDGTEVLTAQGATVMPLAHRHVDRVQIGVTANSNAVPAVLYLDNVAISVR